MVGLLMVVGLNGGFIYSLVMTNSSRWKIPTINGGINKWEKSSISVGHLYHGYVK